ncbi:MAG: hypothetical protein LPK25_14220 [Cyclobacteriaceae bacterium]|nr:hypothetical protein [Cyclobacteriaceae bacterium]
MIDSFKAFWPVNNLILINEEKCGPAHSCHRDGRQRGAVGMIGAPQYQSD